MSPQSPPGPGRRNLLTRNKLIALGALGVAGISVVAAVAGAVAGCSGDEQPGAAQCAQVSAPMTDIPTRTDQEPRLRIPQPQGCSELRPDRAIWRPAALRFEDRNPKETPNPRTESAASKAGDRPFKRHFSDFGFRISSDFGPRDSDLSRP